MNIFLLSIQLLLPVRADSVPVYFPYSIKEPASSFDWKKIELSLPQRYKDSVLSASDLQCPWCSDAMDPALARKEFKRSFHFAELNGDGLPDLIYEGRSGGEANMVHFYLNRKYKMEWVFTDYQYLMDMQFRNNTLLSFVIFNQGCCAETVEFERHFAVDSLFHCRLTIQRAILQGMKVSDRHYGHPDGFFDRPVKFRILNPEYTLRYSPGIIDTLPDDVDFTERDKKNGNIIARYPTGSRGFAWAYKKDTTGREWWLVEMEPAVFLSYKMFYDYDDKLTHYYGWMSSRFLEKLP